MNRPLSRDQIARIDAAIARAKAAEPSRSNELVPPDEPRPTLGRQTMPSAVDTAVIKETDRLDKDQPSEELPAGLVCSARLP